MSNKVLETPCGSRLYWIHHSTIISVSVKFCGWDGRVLLFKKRRSCKYILQASSVAMAKLEQC